MKGDAVTLVFLGTGASGGTPGRGRSRRLESSLLVRGPRSVLIDATRDFPVQAETVERVDLLLLTHAHRDAAGGIPALRRWWAQREAAPIPTLALVLDGAMWGRSLFAHLRADRAVPEVCRWPVSRILLTQIGGSAPAHHALVRLTRRLCPRARPAYDGEIERL